MRKHLIIYPGVRMAATESLPYLLECAKVKGADYRLNMWQFICPELLKAVESEPDNDIKSEHLNALAKVSLFVTISCIYLVFCEDAIVVNMYVDLKFVEYKINKIKDTWKKKIFNYITF